MNAERRQLDCDKTRSRRLLFKRLATLGAVLLTPAILGVSGCATTSDDSRGGRPRTVYDMIEKTRPGEE